MNLSRADIPATLKPNACFVCLDKSEAQQVQECIETRTLLQKEISESSSFGWPYIILAAAGGLLLGTLVTIGK